MVQLNGILLSRIFLLNWTFCPVFNGHIEWSRLAGNLIFGPVFEWLKQDGRPFENRTQIVSKNDHFNTIQMVIINGTLINSMCMERFDFLIINKHVNSGNLRHKASSVHKMCETPRYHVRKQVIENMKASDLSLLSQAIHWPSFKEVTTKY
jgi:hypothetical protein